MAVGIKASFASFRDKDNKNKTQLETSGLL